MENPAPVVLLTYNRPKHTEITINALKNNRFAENTPLFIFCDGPKPKASAGQIRKIEEVREIAGRTEGFLSVTVRPAAQNKGLAASVSGAVTEIVRKFGRVIVLEDDIETSPGFLAYMNHCLNLYADRPEVMHISGYMFPLKTDLPETFFLRPASCWGWATWADSWANFRPDAAKLRGEILNSGKKEDFDPGNTAGHWQQLEDNISGKIRTWAVKWYAAVFLSGGICLHPGRSLVRNIGQDGSGIHSGTATHYDIPELAESLLPAEIPSEINETAGRHLQEFYRAAARKPLHLRIRNKFGRLLRGVGLR